MMRILFLAGFVFMSAGAFPKTITVGKNSSVAGINQAIRLAEPGDTIRVMSGHYREGNIRVAKPLTLVGIDYPVLDGELRHEIMTASGSNITIIGFHFLHSGFSSVNDPAAIGVEDARNIRIESNRIVNSFFAIHMANSDSIVVRNNAISGNSRSEHSAGNGIHLWKCSHALIENNRISGHRDGIYFEFVTSSVIRKNISENNIRYGLHFMFSHEDTYIGNEFRNNGAGVAVMYSKKVKMFNNRFIRNWGASAYGILLKDITDSRIERNTFFKNTVGIHMEGSSRLALAHNWFKENGWALKVQASCDDNSFSNNNFSGNSFDVATNGTTMLNTFRRNYWDKYEGYDLNRDGIGDVPYHPVSMYSMVIEQNPNAVILLHSFFVTVLDKTEKALPGLTPEGLADPEPLMKPNKL